MQFKAENNMSKIIEYIEIEKIVTNIKK